MSNENTWETIDSAPASTAAEPLILGWWNQTKDHNWVQIVGFKNGDKWVDIYNTRTVHPTHWAPLLESPAAPQAKTLDADVDEGRQLKEAKPDA